MSDQHDQNDTTVEDQAFLDGARPFQQVLEHTFAVGFLAVAVVASLFGLSLFGLSLFIGETVYCAFDGDDSAASPGGAVGPPRVRPGVRSSRSARS